MTEIQSVKDKADKYAAKNAERKTLAKHQRRTAYKAAKEHKKTDPRFIAAKEKQKLYRKEAYAKVKERAKLRKDEQKAAKKSNAANDRATKRAKLMATIITANELIPYRETDY